MFSSINEISEFPFVGTFYKMSIDETKPLDEQVEEKVVILETPCDIMESSHTLSNNFIKGAFSVYFPFNTRKDTLEVTNGVIFEADMYGLQVNGKVTGVFPSQMEGVLVYIQDIDA
jgi:hypothetical protein